MCCSTCLVPPTPSLSPSPFTLYLGKQPGSKYTHPLSWVSLGSWRGKLFRSHAELSPGNLGTARAQSSPQQCWFLFAPMGLSVQSRARRTSEHRAKLNCLGVPITCCFLLWIAPKSPPYCTWQSYRPAALAPNPALFVARKEVKTCCAFQL